MWQIGTEPSLLAPGLVLILTAVLCPLPLVVRAQTPHTRGKVWDESNIWAVIYHLHFTFFVCFD